MYLLKDSEDTLIVEEIFKYDEIVWFNTIIKTITGPQCFDYNYRPIEYFSTMKEYYSEREKFEMIKTRYINFRYFAIEEKAKIIDLGNDKNWVEILYGETNEQDCSSDKKSWD